MNLKKIKKINRLFKKCGIYFYGYNDSDGRIIVKTTKKDRKEDMVVVGEILTEMGIVVCNILEELNPNYILIHYYLKELELFNRTILNYKIVNPSMFNGVTKEEE